MKLFAGFIAAAMAIDCPNANWEANSADDKCVPKAGTVTVTCNADTMTVTYLADHLYVEMDPSHADAASSASHAGTCSTVAEAVTSTSGTYEITIPLDGCGTTVDQASGTISFANTIYGNADAIKVDNIITTETLSLDVQCDYSSTFDLLVENIGVEEGTHTLDGTSAAGDFKTEFSLASYIDSGYSTVSSATDPVVIGSPVYNRVSVSGDLPDNVKFVVTDCDAQDDATGSGATYGVIEDGCLDILVNTQEVATLEGDDTTDVDFTFNGFTFDGSNDILHLKCYISLCAIDSNGDFIDSSCGFAYKTTDCVDSSSTLGYTKATAL